MVPMDRKLLDAPDWLYLLRDFDAIYRYGSAGGSKAIRSHRRRAREAISEALRRNPGMLAREPESRPVVEHLSRALDLGAEGALAGLSHALRRVAAGLTWEYGYENVRSSIAKKYAYCEILGPRGPIPSPDLILGLVLFAPGTTYPQHHHRGIEESYISVAGAWSENDAAVYAPGSLVLNRAGHEHRITTGEYEPCLLAYAWTGASTDLAAPVMRFSPSRASRPR